ncbi:glycosyl hydrolase [uncultured Draconibacterium sp.]|uniref:glycosyl hydrolase n=1 Tax=uncultured Draconibacterium sp. TaxID=1573823 RepID=UPI002AA6AACA|nr:glycosyl hydrolase [uncultured Draconibacterium sp.]
MKFNRKLKYRFLVLQAFIVLIGLVFTACKDNSASQNIQLKHGFLNPPDAAKPRVWWHWMNGNVTWEGAKADMDWMKRVGIGGLQSFDAGMTTPQVVDVRLPYMSRGWKDVFAKTAAYADSLDLELGIAASPGWSETGGPWVTAEDAMKKMVWSVTYVEGGNTFAEELPMPPTVTGVFQTSTAGGVLGGRAHGQKPPELYKDQKVIAFKIPADAKLPVPVITSSGGKLNAKALSDGVLEETAIDLPAAKNTGGISWIQFDYGQPVTVRGLILSSTIFAAYYNGLNPSYRSGTPPTQFRLEASDDGENWYDTKAKVQTGAPQRSISVDNVKARYFRFVSIKQAPVETQIIRRFERPAGPPPESIGIKELVLRGEATVHSFEEKAAFANNSWYYDLPSGTPGTEAVVKSEKVIDLTAQMQADGKLNWDAPEGSWIVMRIGYSLTGAMNRPASPEATGLEVDKLDSAAVRRYMETYLSMYTYATNGLIGEHGLKAIMFDSWEASNTNWTPLILNDFKRLRGYDPIPWLPVLAGYVVENAEKTDGFLFDWRRTIQQLLKENHYENLTRILHRRNLIRYGEAHEELYSTMGDGMEMKQSADIPMAAMWQVNKPGEIEGVYFNDNQESASVAHIFGQNISSTESFTGGRPYGTSPWDLKSTADAILLAGSNRFVIHTSTHQPITKGPGMTLGVGQYFTRNETWAEQARPWIEYLTRSSYMLQAGKAANEIAVFYGETSPVISQYRNSYPAVPKGYRYDYVNANVILNRLSVSDGIIVTPTGMNYKLIYFGNGTEKVTLPVLKKVLAMVREGAVLVGTRPDGSPSLSDNTEEVKEILDILWNGENVTAVEDGRVFNSDEVTQKILDQIDLAPDFKYSKPASDSHVMFIHRKLNSGGIYFLANRIDRAETIEASFRITGFKPELWDPATGTISEVSYRIDEDRTSVTVPLDRFGSVFVVFQQPTSEKSLSLSTQIERKISEIEGPWQVKFQAERGAPATAIFDELMDFRYNTDPGIRYFSGVASYSNEIEIPEDITRDENEIWIDLGQVYNLAEVWVNGKQAGTAWKPPFRVNITEHISTGTNQIEIRAVNLWVNRLIGDAQPGVKEKVTLTTRQFYRENSPLVPSGLIGPVQLVQSYRN